MTKGLQEAVESLRNNTEFETELFRMKKNCCCLWLPPPRLEPLEGNTECTKPSFNPGSVSRPSRKPNGSADNDPHHVLKSDVMLPQCRSDWERETKKHTTGTFNSRAPETNGICAPLLNSPCFFSKQHTSCWNCLRCYIARVSDAIPRGKSHTSNY